MISEYSDGSVCGEFQSRSELESQKKYYSILPDLATGWRPRNCKIPAPILITYDDPLISALFTHYCGCLSKLIFVGQRYDNSYQFHSQVEHNYKVKYGLKCEQMPKKLQVEMQQFTLQSSKRKTPFVGMNPKLNHTIKGGQLRFEANFESSNLDLVIKASEPDNQHCYNLFVRPDTNTQGHMQWFYFKVNNANIGKKTIKLKICNNKKNPTLYNRGMKPFIYSKYIQKTKGIKWRQGGDKIKYNKLQLKQGELINDISQRYYSLQFEYTFESDNDDVYFAYCPPFTYSDMKSHIASLKMRTQDMEIELTQSTLGNSLSGLQIPILTITNEAIPDDQKRIVVAMSRIHPGQSNGSYVMKGFLQYIVSPQASSLRDRIIFKVIPMMNPDGVVFGNYRTALAGKDLNRKFTTKNDELYPEIKTLKNYIIKLKKQSVSKLAYFLDFHGHSLKKNCFLYGPDYDIWAPKYEKSKVLPKILSHKTLMFRYQSCLFRVAAGKKTTARAFMLGYIPFCYTVETSVGLYRSFVHNKDHEFDCQKWQNLGAIIGDALKQSVNKIYSQNLFIEAAKKKKYIKNNDKENDKLLLSNKKLQKQNSISVTRSLSSKSLRPLDKKKSTNINNPLMNIMNFQFPQINEVEEESDGYSEGKSDCESDDNDYSKLVYQKLSSKIKKFMEEFNDNVIGKNKKQFRLKSKKKTGTASIAFNGQKNKRKGESEQMKMVPSLKHKILKRELSQKKLFCEDKQQKFFKGSKISIHRLDSSKK